MESLQCAICSERFPDRPSLRTHQSTHSDETPPPREVSKRGLDEQGSTNCQKKRHTGPSSQASSSREQVPESGQSQERVLHPREQQYTGDECQREHASYSLLGMFERYYTGEKHHICRTCGKEYRLRWSLRNHEKVHDTDTGYSSM